MQARRRKGKHEILVCVCVVCLLDLEWRWSSGQYMVATITCNTSQAYTTKTYFPMAPPTSFKYLHNYSNVNNLKGDADNISRQHSFSQQQVGIRNTENLTRTQDRVTPANEPSSTHSKKSMIQFKSQKFQRQIITERHFHKKQLFWLESQRSFFFSWRARCSLVNPYICCLSLGSGA